MTGVRWLGPPGRAAGDDTPGNAVARDHRALGRLCGQLLEHVDADLGHDAAPHPNGPLAFGA